MKKTDERSKLFELLRTFHTAMLVSSDDEKSPPHARPMAIAQVEQNCDIWFLTDRASGKIREAKENPLQGLVVCQSSSAFVSVTGTLEVSRDRAKLDELWNDMYKTWFPQGKEDPNLVLLRLAPTAGEWWDERGVNKVKYLVESVKAFATGTRPDVDPSQHGRVQ